MFLTGAACLLFTMVTYLIWINHASHVEHKIEVEREFLEQARSLASTIEYFLYERGNDIKNLADNRAVVTYFENNGLREKSRQISASF